jgi:mannose-6-phosphate isomerase-like protein (cupin superfamily)
MTQFTHLISSANAEHYVWRTDCDGWHFVKRDDLSIIQERMPAGSHEVKHYHHQARQFFYILDGEATLSMGDETASLGAGQGLEVPPQVPHQIRNDSRSDVIFLVISVPKSHGDRVNVE